MVSLFQSVNEKGIVQPLITFLTDQGDRANNVEERIYHVNIPGTFVQVSYPLTYVCFQYVCDVEIL